MVFRPQRKSADDGQEFVDPMSRYDPPVYNDDMERKLCEDSVTTIVHTPFRSVTPKTTVEEAIRLMVENDTACVMVVEGDHVLGMFTERDILNKVAEHFDVVKNQPVTLVMTHDPAVVHNTDTPAVALNLMAVAGFRHVPILDLQERVIGIIGPRRITAYLRGLLAV